MGKQSFIKTGLELSVDLSGPSNLVVVTHYASDLAEKEALAVVHNSWVDMVEADDDQNKLALKSGKKVAKKPSGSQKPSRGQIRKSSK